MSDRRRYCILVRGEFGETLSAAFADVGIQVGEGDTRLTASVADQCEFYGLLDRLRDFGIELVSVREVTGAE